MENLRIVRAGNREVYIVGRRMTMYDENGDELMTHDQQRKLKSPLDTQLAMAMMSAYEHGVRAGRIEGAESVRHQMRQVLGLGAAPSND